MSLRWDRDGTDWPNREHSRFVEAGGVRWHVQQAGSGPVMLLLHGTGASTHSWAGMLPLLSRRYTVIALDYPGHGFSTPRPSGLLSLPYLARAIGELLGVLAVEPEFIVGHSAGAAIAVRMALDGRAQPRRIVALAGALLPFPGVAQHLFPALAKLLFLNPLVPRLLSWHAKTDDRAVRRTIEGTGSHIDARQLALYARLFRSRRHVDASLALMANWDLTTLATDLPKLVVPLTLVVAERDKFVASRVADEVAALVPSAQIVRVPGLGHLAHEEDPARLTDVVIAAVTGQPVASGSAKAPADPHAPPHAASDTAA